MLYNVVSLRSTPLVKRKKVRRACEFCRQHRVRCDGGLPCGQCRANKIQCSKPTQHSRPPSGTRKLQPAALRSPRPAQSAPPSTPIQEGPNQQVRPRSSSQRSLSTNHAAIAPPRPQLDSFAGFIFRMNNFCSMVSQMSARPSPQPIDPAPSDAQYSSPNLLRTTESDVTYLTLDSLQNLERSVFDVFWTRYHPLMPIISPEDLTITSGQKSEPLRQALMAYCLQSIHYAGLQNRLLSIQMGSVSLHAGEHSHQAPSLASLYVAFFQRALGKNSDYLLYAEPSLLDVQRHLFMAAFLQNSGEYQAAYNIIGVAMRLAQSLDLQHPLVTRATTHEDETRRHVWWTLVHLDFHCSRLLGKPMAISLDDAILNTPLLNPQDPWDTPELGFHSASISLTVVARKMAEDLERHVRDASGTIDPYDQIERHAHFLSREIKGLYRWRDQILDANLYTNITLICNVYQPDEVTSSMSRLKHDQNATLSFHEAPALTLQKSLLELQYHDIILWAHRPFIQFPSRGLVPQRSPQADIHATTALQHALTVTDLIHTRMLYNDALYGCPEIYQYVWNAVLTLVGFMLAYPLCYWFPLAQQHVERSLPIFEGAGTDNPIASRAAQRTRYLLGRVSALIELLSSQSSAFSDRNDHRRVQTDEQMDAENQQSLPFASEENALWSFADTVDPNTWSGYCHEISDMLMDVPEIHLGTNF
ncbi:uncharacterized protein AKAW2_40219A [Aspergillus luchuensis]|uniref:Zn(2)-C6 fungal-type domain-containing protein n=1 Tax=Aspergillus kawachii TaxID=1069201 RepID=A0A7R7W8X9_ASPKA|nr:uncharacterized protein AKAW2_40219A [Aspergillus luchuensis]BCR98536.1 hypothetical protein AKAW2_40219A [Aspergillus luchuensis]GAA90124.1 hypothetical protein AKAW_08238 [Aspergillus luchuensis IFO 4308]